MLSLYLEVWSRVDSVSRSTGNLPFGATARCKYAVQMPIEGTIGGANGRSRHKGHCRAVVAATMGPSAVECRGVKCEGLAVGWNVWPGTRFEVYFGRQTRRRLEAGPWGWLAAPCFGRLQGF